ncbi:MAG TPA: lipid-A-disaccharide synthase N-terminal domain-containing protein [Alphaproteobacteria bacterium]|nr:lipid-A-disaccharide synthase N-terminal domain-containing protein [Alphaproteobacteria bacterium]USO06283.1 MAG: lipid-A-disaccharide synthase N-terminal domain-containing protein [Rhodospirillales bacterium]HOO81112.1 lipid-A-disaccharide synthase N-terminal domain-containing protein [Alphaproteobacteria bacterium]
MTLTLPALNFETVWLAIGFLGQGLFFMRFFVQWLASEKAGKSVMPDAFWYFSLAGGLVLFSYAIWRQDPVFMLGQSTGLFIYARNLYFIHNKEKDGTPEGVSGSN